MSSQQDSPSAPKPSPGKHSRAGSLKGFIPLHEESTISTRGQVLPGLISSRSSATISSLGRKTSKQWGDDDMERGRPASPDSHLGRSPGFFLDYERERRDSSGFEALMAPAMRSQRLIGNSNPRYKWEQYWTSEEQLKKMKKPVQYYERCNNLLQQYAYIDRLLDSSLPHTLIQEYNDNPHNLNIPSTISEESPSGGNSPNGGVSPTVTTPLTNSVNGSYGTNSIGTNGTPKVKRTAKQLYKIPDEDEPLLSRDSEELDPERAEIMPLLEPEEDLDSGAPIVTLAIYINLVANIVLLIAKIIVTVMTSSVSVLASLVDAALDFLSTAIVWTTTYLIARQDPYKFPVGRRKLEPIGVLIFSVVMITSFVQVALEGFKRIRGEDHSIIDLTIPAVTIMASTVVIKFACWLWCRLIKNSSVQALAQDAMTDVVFNIFSIIFPLVGSFAKVWWLDPLGGILLSFYVVINWSSTSGEHIQNLSGAAATPDERNVLLYLTMRFAKSIKQIQGLQAYHAGDKLNVEVDLVLDESMSLRDSHDLGESLQYVLESVPTVDRAFVHMDYKDWNLPSHLNQQAS